MKCESLHRKCSRDHPQHIRIEGKYTKQSAVYVEGLAEEIARVFAVHLQRMQKLRVEKELDVKGLEDPISDDLCLTLDWKVLKAWRWSKPSHINVLETASSLKAWDHVAMNGGDKRFVYLSDSNVSRSVLVRGRSSAESLRAFDTEGSSNMCCIWTLSCWTLCSNTLESSRCSYKRKGDC